MLNDIERVCITKEQIENRLNELAKKINEDFGDEKLIVICVLRGAIMFFADIFRRLNMDARMAFLDVSSYGSKTESEGNVHLRYDLDADIEGENVLIVEDIIDSGNTLKYVLDLLKIRQPKTIKTCCLLDKISRRKVNIVPDYTGFVIKDEFVVGYGLDYSEVYRNMNLVGVLKKEIYS